MEGQIENSCPVPQGILLVIGGKEEKEDQKDDKRAPETYVSEEILKTFVFLIGKPDATIEIITTGSSDPDEYFSGYQQTFSKMGEFHPIHLHHRTRKEALNDDLQTRIDQADGLFFSGGDQLKLTSIYGGTPFLVALKNKYIQKHFVIAGTSAGAMALSSPMIYAGNDEVQQIAGEVKVTLGLEFLKDVCIDTHFVKRSRFVRLAQVIATNPTCIGFGLEENTAMIVRKGQDMEVIGSGVVTVMEGFNLENVEITSFRKNMHVSLRNLNVHLLGRGDKYTITQVNPPHV
jgi:cyanophycinase